MKCKVLAAWFGVLFVGTPAVYAGFIAPGGECPRQDSPGPAVTLQLQTPRFLELPSQHPSAAGLLVEPRLRATWPAHATRDSGPGPNSENGQLTTLPPAPDSALLAMSGLLSLGAIQLGRNVRKLNLGALPEWYHDGGPTQVGHSTPFDLDLGFNLAALPVCVFAGPVGAEDTVLFGAQWSDAVRRAPQFWPTTKSPRGPPSVS